MLVAEQIRAQKNFRHSFSASLALAISLMCDWKSCPPPTPKQWSQFIAPGKHLCLTLRPMEKYNTAFEACVGRFLPPTNVIVILEMLSAGGPNDKMGGIRQSIWGRGGDNPLIWTAFVHYGGKAENQYFVWLLSKVIFLENRCPVAWQSLLSLHHTSNGGSFGRETPFHTEDWMALSKELTWNHTRVWRKARLRDL